MSEHDRQLRVLLVDDSPDHIFLFKEVASTAAKRLAVSDVRDGPSALAFLRRQAPFDTTHSVDVVLLDLNMPRMSGWEVLAEIRKDEQLRLLPVVILTSSTAESDIRRAYACAANSYIAKPISLVQFGDILAVFEKYWNDAVSLPHYPELA